MNEQSIALVTAKKTFIGWVVHLDINTVHTKIHYGEVLIRKID